MNYKKIIAREWLIFIGIIVVVTIFYGFLGYYLNSVSETEYALAMHKYDDQMNTKIKEILSDWKAERPITINKSGDGSDFLLFDPHNPPSPGIETIKYEIAIRVRKIFSHYSSWTADEIVKRLPELVWDDFPRKPRYYKRYVFGDDSFTDLLTVIFIFYIIIMLIRSIILSVRMVRTK